MQAARRDQALIAEPIRRIVSEIEPILGSPGERYLREERGIDTDAIADILVEGVIGWHPALRFSEPGHPLHGRHLGAIVANLSAPETARPTGAISRTFIGPDGKKVCPARSLGHGGGVCRLSRDEDVLCGLHIAEGLESALSAAALGFRPVWSTGSASTMAAFPLLVGIEALTLVADNDPSGAGERAAREAEARWLEAGREVRIFMRDEPGDINDALKAAKPWG